MSGGETPGGGAGTPPEPQALSTSRLFLIIVLFVVLAVYSIWNSDRFQTLLQGVSEQRLSELLQRPVSFRRVEFQVFPPTVRLADVRIGNDPRIPGEPLLEVEELSIGGGVSVTGRELRLGRVRAVHPTIALVQFPDGTWNLPPGLTGPAGNGGLQVKIGELVVQQGVFVLDGRKMGVDARLDDFAVELFSETRNRYRGTFACRRVTLALPSAEPLVFALDLRFRLDPARGASVEALRASGAFGELRAAGSLEDFRSPTILLETSGEFHIAEVERIFHAELGFRGDARFRGNLRIPPSGAFLLTGRVSAPRVVAQGFTLEDLAAAVAARPEALVASIEKVRYAGGAATGSLRIENLAGGPNRPHPMTLTVDAKGVSLERFFADIGLPGTGLAGSAALTAALRWSEGGIERANGGATLSIEAGRAVSIVRGRSGIPTSGGGPLAIVDGRIGFESAVFRFPASSIELTGGLQIGTWMPDFDFHLRSRDLPEVDRLFQNFVAASGDRPEPLGLGGSGEAEGHLAGSWSDPDATAQFSAESARYAGVLFGSVRGSVDMRDGAFDFRPLRVYDGSATLSLEGLVRFREDPARQTLDATLTAKDYPVSRFLDYLDLDYPVEGRVTGTLPLSGNPPAAVSGGGLVVLADAVLWGQSVPAVSGRLTLAPGRVAFDDVRADIGGGIIGGRAEVAYEKKTFEVRAAGDRLPIESFEAVRELSGEVAGLLSFELSGSGPLDDPDLTVSATLSDARFFGHAVPDELAPRLAVRVVRGDLDGSVSVPGRWSLAARGDPFGEPARISLALDAPDLAAFLLLTPVEVPPGVGGALHAQGQFTLPERKGEWVSGEVTVTEARFDAEGRPGLLRTAGPARLRLSGGRVTLEEFHATGEGVDLAVRGTLDMAAGKPTLAARISGETDASVLALVVPDPGLAGRLTLDVAARGPLENLALDGSVRIEGGRYRLAGYALDDIDGSIRIVGSAGEIEGLRAKVGEGEAFVAGNFRLEGATLKDFRLVLQARRVQVRAIPALRLTVDADLVASGNEAGNLLRGEITLLRGTYSKDFELTVSDLLSRSRPGGGIGAREPWKERTALDIRVVSAASLEVRNNLARLSGTVDLRVRGTLADPVLLGQVLLDEGGRVVFSDIRYEIEHGAITFSNTTRIAPFIDLSARAEVKGYQLTVSLVGTWPRVTANFVSDPPLSNDAILGLVLSGAPPDTRASADTTGQLVSAAGGVISGAVTGGLTRRTQQIFRLDRFQIDPVFEGSSLSTIRTTIGKQITQDLSVVSSIAIDSSKQPIIRIEWQATNTILVQLLRDENGILSLTFRKRQRF